MKVWVTGSGGQVGHVLMNVLKSKGIDCFGTKREEADIADEAKVRSLMQGVTHIVNAAAYAQVDPAETQKDLSLRANAEGPETLARVAKESGARLIHISTDYVFDGKLSRPYVEEDETNPLNWYGYTKREGEIRVLKTYPEACVVRVSWVFGGHGNRHFASQVLNLISQRKELKFVNDQIGRPTYALDFAHALAALLNCSGIYHYSNRGSLSKYAFTRAIWEWAKQRGLPMVCETIVPIPSSDFPTPAKRPLYTVFNTAKIESILPIRPWREALGDYMSGL